MTRRSSLRAQAREIYRELAAAKAAASPQTPLIPAQAGIQGDPATPVDRCPGSPLEPVLGAAEGRARVRGRAEVNPTAHNLTEKVRALYEGSAVPVREIAAIAGVTERTVYKYARKQRWKPRYRWLARGTVDRGRRWRQRPGFAPVKGAGARFIRRADKDQPVAAGLKATDPAGAARAVESCGAAASLSREAQAEVAAEQRGDALNRAIAWTGTALRNLREFHQRRGKGPPGPLDLRIEGVLMRIVTMTLSQWQALVAEEEAALSYPSP